MSYIARLVSITQISSVTKELLPFVHFQAEQKKVKVTDDTNVAILQIENIPSYHIVFLDTDITLEEVEAELEKNDTKLARETRALLGRQMSGEN
jgi:hypothetical protein